MPVSPLTTTSVLPSIAVATIGSPAAIACGMTRGSPSQSDAIASTSAAPRRSGTSRRSPVKITWLSSFSAERRAATAGRKGPSPAITIRAPGTFRINHAADSMRSRLDRRDDASKQRWTPSVGQLIDERRQVLIGHEAGDQVVVGPPPGQQQGSAAGRRAFEHDVGIGDAGRRRAREPTSSWRSRRRSLARLGSSAERSRSGRPWRRWASRRQPRTVQKRDRGVDGRSCITLLPESRSATSHRAAGGTGRAHGVAVPSTAAGSGDGRAPGDFVRGGRARRTRGRRDAASPRRSGSGARGRMP